MDQKLLQDYARLIVETGVHVQPGQAVQVNAQIDQGALVTEIVAAAYAAGAASVAVDWSDTRLDRLHYAHQSTDLLGRVKPWQEAKWQARLDELPAQIHLISDDPDVLKGVDRTKMQTVQQMRLKVIKPYRDKLENREQWTIAAAPSVAWAQKVFPELAANEAVERLWQEILRAVRVDGLSDPVAAWEAHNRLLKARSDKINQAGLTGLRYHSANGTDFTVGLIPTARWQGGADVLATGIRFNPNLPTEEIFTSPMRGEAEGRLVATMPLSYQGELIDGFWIEFEDGKAVRWQARQGQVALDKMMTMDEGAAYLGEVALVPQASPIAESGVLFYNTLFDENASCHVALGRGYSGTLVDFAEISLEEAQARGINSSIIHVDFMIGSDDLSVTGITADGREVPLLVAGNWHRDFEVGT